MTIDHIQAEALNLIKARAAARAQRAYNYERDDLGQMIDALAYLALRTDFGDETDSEDISNLADCVADYLKYWGEQLECTFTGQWQPGLDGSGIFIAVVDGLTYAYRVRYRAHHLSAYNDHIEFRHVDEDMQPIKAPNPVSDTGYRSEFVPSPTIDDFESPEAWIEGYLKERAQSWKPPINLRQLSLFDERDD